MVSQSNIHSMGFHLRFPNSPSAKCRISDFDDDILRVLDLGDWPPFDGHLELALEHHGLHRSVRSHDVFCLALSHSSLRMDLEKRNNYVTVTVTPPELARTSRVEVAGRWTGEGV